jgi:hypothetical protein
MLVVDSSDPAVHLASHATGARVSGGKLEIPLPAVEVGVSEHLPEFGAETKQMKVLEENYSGRSLTLQLAAQSGSMQTLYLRENMPQRALASKDAELSPAGAGLRTLTMHFPEGSGYASKTVTLTW